MTSDAQKPSLSTRPAFRVGIEFESSLSGDERDKGSHFTPPHVALRLSEVALQHWKGRTAPRIWDPSCGGGAFLVAAADTCVGAGMDPETVISEQIFGSDISGQAVAVSRRAISHWCDEHGLSGKVSRAAEANVVCADALADKAAFGDRRFEIVIGNPPFQSQLSSNTARDSIQRERLQKRFVGLIQRYVDTASIFSIVVTESLVQGGVSLLIQPKSIMGATDSLPIRNRLLEQSGLRWIWIPTERVFEASVDVCAPLLVLGETGSSTEVVSGGLAEESKGVVPLDSLVGRDTWAELWANAHDVPQLGHVSTGGTVGDVATATAGFRDEFYGIAHHLTEAPTTGGAPALRPVLTSGMINPAQNLWGKRRAKIAKVQYGRPALDVDALQRDDPRIARWVEARRVPKVLVATQTKVIEALGDPDGELVPLTPLISVEGNAEMIPKLESALCAPPATIWALRRYGGTALSSGALKLSAKSVLTIPIPGMEGPWSEATKNLQHDDPDWSKVARLLCDSWQCDHEIGEWWIKRCAGVLPEPLQ